MARLLMRLPSIVSCTMDTKAFTVAPALRCPDESKTVQLLPKRNVQAMGEIRVSCNSRETRTQLSATCWAMFRVASECQRFSPSRSQPYLGCCVIASDWEFSCYNNVDNESENPMCCSSNMYRDLANSLSLSLMT
jgi:hypothetical protein